MIVPEEISDRDIERIASRVVQKLLTYALVIAAAIWLMPTLFFLFLSSTASATRALPFPVAVALTAAVLALPVVALIWAWGRRRTR
jgi:hypothetical protein